jgi:hypothetical protein
MPSDMLSGSLAALSVVATMHNQTGDSELQPTTPTSPEATSRADQIPESSSKHRRGQHGQVVGLDEDNCPCKSKMSARRSPIPESDASAVLTDARVMELRSTVNREHETSEAKVLRRMRSSPERTTKTAACESAPCTPLAKSRHERKTSSPLSSERMTRSG